PLVKSVGLSLELTRAVAPSQLRSAARQSFFRGVHVALHLGERDRSFRQAAIRVENGVEGILPALVHEPVRGLAMIFDEAVAIPVGRAVNPGERGFQIGPDRADRLVISRSLRI